MQSEFYNQPVVNWAKQNLAQPVEIKLRFASRRAMIFVYLLLFSFPLLVIAGFIYRKIDEGDKMGWGGVFLCGGVILLPYIVIVLLGVLTRQKLVKSLDASGVKSSLGRKFLWENLYYVDHVSKRYRVGNVSRKIEDNQLELVFADGKTIIPPLIHDRERIWNLVNSIPAQVKDDGELRTAQSAADRPQNAAGNQSFDEIVKAMGEMKAEHDRNK
jgi:hypothetical protein